MHEDPAGDPPLQQLHHSAATARLPEGVGRGVFATGAIILNNATELLIDFVQGIANPRRVAARVVLSHVVAAQFAAALEDNLARYAASFGGPPRMPAPSPANAPASTPSPAPAPAALPSPAVAPGPQPEPGPAAADDDGPDQPPPAAGPSAAAAPPITDVYEQIRLSDEMLGGAYANVVAITHTPSEFCFDFIANVYPRSVVTARVYLAAPRVPEVVASLRRSVGPRQAG